jgi:hypothetical protein
VLNWNNADDTIECLESLIGQDRSDFIIVLGDNGSAESDREKLEVFLEGRAGIDFLPFDSNHGFAKAHILMWQHVQQRYPGIQFMLLLNNDAIAKEDWISRMIEFARGKEVGMVSCRMINYYQRSQLDNVGHRVLTSGEVIPIGFEAPVGDYSGSIVNVGACGGAALYKVSMIKDIGFFDPWFDTGYEDAEYGLRAIIAGYQSVYQPEAIVWHKISRSVEKVKGLKYSIRIQQNIFYSFFKLMPFSYLIIHLPQWLLKQIFLFVLNLISLRIRMFRVHLFALIRLLFGDLWTALKARGLFYKGRRVISYRALRGKMIHFLRFDARRFIELYWKGEHSVFED